MNIGRLGFLGRLGGVFRSVVSGPLLQAAFTAANGTHVSNYTPETGPALSVALGAAASFQVQSNKAVNVASGDAGVYTDVGSTTNHLEFNMNGGGAAHIFWWQDANNHWYIRHSPAKIVIYQITAGTPNLRKSLTLAPTANELLSVDLDHTTDIMTCSVNSVVKTTYNASALAPTHTTKCGIISGNALPTVDNWKVTA